MSDDARKLWMSFRIMSQASWRSPARARLLLELFQRSDVFGTMSRYRINDGRERAIKSFKPERLIEQIEAGRLRFLEAEGMDVVPVDVFSSVNDADWDERIQQLVGMNRFCAGRQLGELRERHSLYDMTPWLTMLEYLAAPLALRYGGIREYGFTEYKRDQHKERWVTPQYCSYVERVMLFGPPECERFGAEYLRGAPVHEVRELDCGAILLITSPDSLDASVPEDEALFDRVYHYLMAHPNAGKLM